MGTPSTPRKERRSNPDYNSHTPPLTPNSPHSSTRRTGEELYRDRDVQDLELPTPSKGKGRLLDDPHVEFVRFDFFVNGPVSKFLSPRIDG